MIMGQTSTGAGWADPGSAYMLDGYDFVHDTYVGPCAINCINNHEIYSFHPGGANMLLVDGSARFTSQGIDIAIVAALVTRAGGEAIPASD